MQKIEGILKDLNNENLYKILNIERTKDEIMIKIAYKRMIKKYHPDKNKAINTVEIFEKIRKAFEILSNSDLKALYDSYLDKQEFSSKRIKVFSDKRKKFLDELKKREEQEQEQNEFAKKDVSHNINKTRKEDTINLDFNIIKTKSFDEKLNESGIKIKWDSNVHLIFNKDIIHSYFKDYGNIEDILCEENKCRAYILFLSNKSVIQLFNDLHKHNYLTQIFKIKKINKKLIPQHECDYKKIKSSYLDSNTLNTIRNIKMMNNVKFMERDHHIKPVTKKFDVLENFHLYSLEDLEKIVFEKLKMKLKNTN